MNRTQLFILYSIVFLSFLGIALPYPIFSPLFLHSESYFLVDYSIESKNILLGITLSTYPFGLFFGSLLLGWLSDHYGRKKVFFLSECVAAVGYFWTCLALNYQSIEMLIFSRLLTGFAEGNVVIPRAYCSEFKDFSKHQVFGGISAATSLGFLFGPLFASVLSNPFYCAWFTFVTPFYVAGLLSVIVAVIAATFLPDQTFSLHTRDKWSNISKISLFKDLLTYCHLTLFFLIFAIFFVTLAADILYEFAPIYFVSRWDFYTQTIATYNLLLCIGLIYGNYWLLPYLAIRVSFYHCILVTLYVYLIGFVGIIFGNQVLIFFIMFIMGVTIGISNTILSVRISDQISKQHQGKIMGVIMSMRTLGHALICLGGGFIAAYNAQLPLYMGVIAIVLSIILILLCTEKETVRWQQ